MATWYEKVGSEISKIGKEVGKGAKVAAIEVGKGAKAAANEVRKTVGVGVGELKLDLEKLHYHPSDSVLGKLNLNLSEATDAKRLVVGLRGSRQKTSYSKGAGGKQSQDTHDELVHEFEIELAGEQAFEAGVYDFELHIPTDAIEVKPEIRADGLLGDVARVVTSIATSGTSSVSWQVFAFLDIPWKRNLNHKVDIAVTDVRTSESKD